MKLNTNGAARDSAGGGGGILRNEQVTGSMDLLEIVGK